MVDLEVQQINKCNSNKLRKKEIMLRGERSKKQTLHFLFFYDNIL